MLMILSSFFFINMKYWGELIIVICLFSLLYFPYFYSSSVSYISNYLMMDDYSSCLIMLSFWVIMMCMLSSLKIKNSGIKKKLFLLLMNMLFVALLISFSVNNLLLFYIGFEFCLIPVFFLILGFGYQPERVEAGMYMFFYTLLGSFPLLVMILNLYQMSGSGYMYNQMYFLGNSLLMYLFFVLGFLIKFPIYLGHLWLLKAHVEAPVAGSMILAGVLLKLGGYGLIRVLTYMIDNLYLMKELVSVLSLMGSFFVALSCLRHFDMKLLVASSSVVHMSFCIISVFVMSEMSFKGLMITMVAHGICSSGLFYGVNLVYERTSSRSLVISKGLLSILPSFMVWWFLLLCCNLSAPPSINLLGELNMIISILNWELSLLFIMILVCFFSAAYTLYLFSLSSHGRSFLSNSVIKHINMIEHMVFFLHVMPLNMLIMYGFLLY